MMSTPGEVEARLMRVEDLDAVLEVQRSSYVEHLHERRETYEGMMQAHPTGCFVACVDGCVGGYFLTHPASSTCLPPPLDTGDHGSSGAADIYYMHDLAVHKNFRGRSLAKALIAKCVTEAERCSLDRIALTAVLGADAFWAKFGFVRGDMSNLSSDTLERLATYGDVAPVLMFAVREDVKRCLQESSATSS